MANTAAQSLKDLHIPSQPVIFPNIWDVPSLIALVSLNSSSESPPPVKAIATASWAIAASYGIPDEELSQGQNLSAIATIAPFAAKFGLPLSVDLQDGYGDLIGETVRKAVEAGAAGANIEDSIPSAGFGRGIDGSLYPIEEQISRLKTALSSASHAGCQNFVLNARCDIFVLSPSEGLTSEIRMQEAIARGKAYLQLGATTVFYWGAALGRQEIEKLVRELDGRVAIQATAVEGMSVKDLSALGVARISVGPRIFKAAMDVVREEARKLLVA